MELKSKNADNVIDQTEEVEEYEEVFGEYKRES